MKTFKWDIYPMIGGEFEPNVPVAFNRSIQAHNHNKEINKSFSKNETHLAVDRRMFLLKMTDLNGKLIGQNHIGLVYIRQAFRMIISLFVMIIKGLRQNI